MSLELKDPRKYSSNYPKTNVLITQAVADLAKRQNNKTMLSLLEDLLKKEQDQQISLSFNLAPSFAAADYMWQCLQEALAGNGLKEYAKLFAIPVVIVVGSNHTVSLPNQIDGLALTELLLKKHIFSDSKNCFISGKLYDLDGIVQLKPSQLYTWMKEISNVAMWNENSLSNAVITNLSEGVYLRFLCGVSLVGYETARPMNEENFSKLGLELAQLLSQSLKTEGATIFSLPFPPCKLSAAALVGEHHRKEISVAVNLSNIVKRMRMAGKYPEVQLIARDEEIIIEVWDQGANHAASTLNWPLQRADNFQQICQILTDLFADMRLATDSQLNADMRKLKQSYAAADDDLDDYAEY